MLRLWGCEGKKKKKRKGEKRKGKERIEAKDDGKEWQRKQNAFLKSKKHCPDIALSFWGFYTFKWPLITHISLPKIRKSQTKKEKNKRVGSPDVLSKNLTGFQKMNHLLYRHASVAIPPVHLREPAGAQDGSQTISYVKHVFLFFLFIEFFSTYRVFYLLSELSYIRCTGCKKCFCFEILHLYQEKTCVKSAIPPIDFQREEEQRSCFISSTCLLIRN